MISFKQINNSIAQCEIDSLIFNEDVITKALYWLTADYFIFQKKNNTIFEIQLELKEGSFSENKIDELKSQLNQNLIDFKTRNIINIETKSIREILLVKAFANNDDFEDFNLTLKE
jgi:His-Xaa-Ser system protein HxsD